MNALHVPKVKELMRENTQEGSFEDIPVEIREQIIARIRMLKRSLSEARNFPNSRGIDDKRIALERSIMEEICLGVNNISDILFQRIHFRSSKRSITCNCDI